MAKQRLTTHIVRGSQGRKALASQIRLEILDQFASSGSMSIAEVASRMGRPPSALYYHFGVLEEAGILRRERNRSRGKKLEARYRPVAPRIALAVERETGSGGADARKALAAAFRMAEGDFAAALESGDVCQEGGRRNLFATRMHCRLTPAALVELNRHLRALEAFMEREGHPRKIPADADQFVSLTLALLPLRGRNVGRSKKRTGTRSGSRKARS